MRPLYLALVSLALLILMVYLGYSLGTRGYVPNPLSAELSINQGGILDLAGVVLEYLALGNYSGALLYVELANSTPSGASLVDVISGLRDLATGLSTLDEYHTLMQRALVGGNQSGARLMAMRGIDLGSRLYAELGRIIGVIGPRYKAYTEDIAYKLSLYNKSFISALSSGYIATNLSVHVEPASVWVGGYLNVSGRLVDIHGAPVVNATVVARIMGITVGTFTTDSEGGYGGVVAVPRIYVRNATLVVTYDPPLGSAYLPSNASVTVGLLYNETEVFVVVNSALWGSPVEVWGYVNGPPGRVVSLSLGNVSLSSRTNAYGYFRAAVPTGAIVPGEYLLRVTVGPVGNYSPAILTVPVNVSGIRGGVNCSMPWLLVAGFSVVLRCRVDPWLGRGEVIRVVLPGSTIVNLPMDSGDASLSLHVPLTSPMGFGNVDVILQSNPPLIGGAYSGVVFIINPVALSILALGVPLLLALRGARVRVVEAGAVTTEPASIRDGGGLISSVISMVGARTGVWMRPSDTLREYFARVRDKLSPNASLYLWELFLALEQALYSPSAPHDLINRIEELASRVMGELR